MNNVLKRIFFSLFLIIITIPFGCMNENENNLYVLSREDSIYKESLKTPNGMLIAPPKAKYARNTFLIDTNSFVYFYSFQGPIKMNGVSDDQEPDTIGLMPNHIFKIPMGMERAFFEENVQQQLSQQAVKSVVIALFKDSTKNEFLQYLLKFSKDKSNKLSLRIRFALPEERSVLKYKLKGEHYSPN